MAQYHVQTAYEGFKVQYEDCLLYTSHSKRRFAALKGVEQVRIPQLGSALLVQNGQASVLVVLQGEIAFGGGIEMCIRDSP